MEELGVVIKRVRIFGRRIHLSDHWKVYLSKSKTLIRVDVGIFEDVPIKDAVTLLEVNIKSRGFFQRN